jgi:hypothetical protein
MLADSQTTNPGPSGQPLGLRELDATLAEMMGLGPRKVRLWRPGGIGPEVVVWTANPAIRDGTQTLFNLAAYLLPPAYSTSPAASAELKRWLLASGRFDEITVSAYPLIGEVEVRMTPAGGGEDDRVVFNRPLGPDPVAAECEAVARCSLKALAGKGAGHAG